MSCGKVTVLMSDVLKLIRSWVDDLDIAREVLVAIDFREVVESLISDFRYVKFVITDGQEIKVNSFENLVGDKPIR